MSLRVSVVAVLCIKTAWGSHALSLPLRPSAVRMLVARVVFVYICMYQ